MNGIIQMLVKSENRAFIQSLLPIDTDDSMKAEQKAHHVTLAFKPADEEAAKLRKQFCNGALLSHTRVLADKEIAALFGDLYINGVCIRKNVHITLGGTVPPKESSRLLKTATFVNDRFEGNFRLDYHEVNF